MGIWLTVLKTLPWGEVITNAPKVADGARKLWQVVAKKPPPDPAAVETAVGDAPASERSAVAALEARIAPLEAAAADTHGQMLQSAELIRTLAEQNTQLVQRVEALRVRLLWLAACTGALAVAVVAGFAWTMLR
ncbi:MAG TPA: hypothetical protein VFZ93_10385 [Albitalea sp.]